eukprot:850278-Rhodomonas_salina.1
MPAHNRVDMKRGHGRGLAEAEREWQLLQAAAAGEEDRPKEGTEEERRRGLAEAVERGGEKERKNVRGKRDARSCSSAVSSAPRSARRQGGESLRPCRGGREEEDVKRERDARSYDVACPVTPRSARRRR